MLLACVERPDFAAVHQDPNLADKICLNYLSTIIFLANIFSFSMTLWCLSIFFSKNPLFLTINIAICFSQAVGLQI